VYVATKAIESLDFYIMASASPADVEDMRSHIGYASTQHALRMGSSSRFDEVPILRRSLDRFTRATFTFSTLPAWITDDPVYADHDEYLAHETRIGRWFLLVILGFIVPPAPPVAFDE